MEATEIQERNEQIALMLGMKMQETYVTNWKEFNSLLHSIEDTLKFHSNWNWLMEAVEFIENKLKLGTVISNMGFGINNQYININRGVSIVDETIDNPSKIMGKSSTKKEAVFIAVSDFAKLYNNKEL